MKIKLYLHIINWLNNNKRKFAIFLLLFIVFVGFFTQKVSFKSTINDFVPQTLNLRKSLRLLDHLQKSSEIILHLKLKDNIASLDMLVAEIDKLKISLACNNFEIKNFGGADFFNNYQSLLNYLPLIFTEDYEDFIKERIRVSNIFEQMESNYKTLLTPLGTFQKVMIKYDPLLIGGYLLEKLKGLSKILGSQVVLENGWILSKDYKNAFLIVLNKDKLDSIRDSSKIIKDLNSSLKDLNSLIAVEVISSHIHSSFNEKIIKIDARRAVILAIVALLLIILFLFKDINGIWVFVIPSLSFFPSILVLSLFFEKVSLITIGFGAMIIGISIDYGIHLFSSIKNSSINNSGKDVISILKPLTLSLLSTLVAFSLFFISSSIGYRQLALFAIVSISFTFLFSVLILPVFIKFKSERVSLVSFSPFKSRWLIISGVVILVLLFSLSLKNNFQRSIRFFDNTPQEVFQAEDDFMKIFGKSSIPIIMSTGISLEVALQKEEMIADKFQGGVFVSTIFPSKKRSLENIKRWNGFWNENRDKLKTDIIKAALKTGFSNGVFDGFFKQLDRADLNNINIPVLIEEIASGSFISSLDKVDVISYLLDKEKLLDIKMMTSNMDGSFLFFKDYFLSEISNTTMKELKQLSLIIFIIFFFIFILSSFKQELFLVIIPVATGILVPLAILGMLEKKVNAAHIAGLIVVFGLSVDYGVFMIFQLRNLKSAHIYQGIKISVITTLTGAITLLLAKHTILASLGFSIFFGVLGGFLASFILLPPIYFYLKKKGGLRRLITQGHQEH